MNNKIIIGTIGFAFFINSTFSQVPFAKAGKERTAYKLKGNVKSILINRYHVVNVNGTIQNGTKEACYEYIYDPVGRKVQDISFDLNPSFAHWYKYRYNMKGKMLGKTRLDANGNIIETETYDYDDNGYLVTNNNGINYIYTKGDHDLFQVEVVQSNGYHLFKKYDIQGNEVSSISNLDGDESDMTTRKFDFRGNEIEHVWYNAKTKKSADRDVFKYDINNNKTEWIKFDPSGNPDGHGYYKYDGYGNEIEFKWFNPDGTLRYTSTSNYTYDVNKNWIKRYEFHDGIPTFYTERTLEYY